MKDGIRILTVCPGWVDTQMMQRDLAKPGNEDKLGVIKATSPVGRMTDPVEVALAVVALCLPALALINGAAIPMDHGMTAAFA